MKDNVLDIAIVVGGAFATIIITSSLVANVIAPTIGLFSSGVDLA
ncbi:MAG: large conductance mechanosensitive channel, partial [Cognaticolwellia sp.]